MNDAGQGRTAAGSWQPDPTGRFKLRWRNAAGNWTDHVYSSEGQKGNDPYDPLAPQPASQPEAQPQGDPTMAKVGLMASCAALVLLVAGVWSLAVPLLALSVLAWMVGLVASIIACTRRDSLDARARRAATAGLVVAIASPLVVPVLVVVLLLVVLSGDNNFYIF